MKVVNIIITYEKSKRPFSDQKSRSKYSAIHIFCLYFDKSAEDADDLISHTIIKILKVHSSLTEEKALIPTKHTRGKVIPSSKHILKMVHAKTKIPGILEHTVKNCSGRNSLEFFFKFQTQHQSHSPIKSSKVLDYMDGLDACHITP